MSNHENLIDLKSKTLPGKLYRIGAILLLVGLVIVVLGFWTEKTRAAFNSLVLLMFLSSIGVGSLFLVAIEYLGGAVWSTPFRRISEFLAATLIILPLIALPVYFNLHDLFHWTHIEAVEVDPILKGKEAYLNIPFFTIRVLFYFAVWILFYFLITRNSYKQDITKDSKLTRSNIRLSAIFMPVFGLTITFASIDWMMSLEPHWFSTIFGVYYFSGTVLAALASATFIIVLMNEKGFFVKGIVSDHYYSLGALLFAFTNFWAYIAFSQFMLIWYANLPEETVWFLQRWEGSWIYFSIALMIIHFVVPYFGLVSQPSKTNPKRLIFMSLWILAAHFMDLYWMIMPTYSKSSVSLGWMEIGFPLVAIGILILVFMFNSSKKNIIPVGDPKLKRGMDFRL